jgi:hypothetical protein
VLALHAPRVTVARRVLALHAPRVAVARRVSCACQGAPWIPTHGVPVLHPCAFVHHVLCCTPRVVSAHSMSVLHTPRAVAAHLVLLAHTALVGVACTTCCCSAPCVVAACPVPVPFLVEVACAMTPHEQQDRLSDSKRDAVTMIFDVATRRFALATAGHNLSPNLATNQ